MAMPLRVLVVEDSEDDVLLVTRELQRGGCDVSWERVETREAMAEALDRGPWDLILSDFRMPRFSAAEALALYREREVETPFILVSGTVGEEQAVELMKAGAHDFFLKDRLTRLCPAVDRELREAENRRARRRAEAEREESRAALARSEYRLSRLIEFAPDAMVITDASGQIVLVNTQTERLFGYRRDELLGQPVEMLVPERFRGGHRGQRSSYIANAGVRAMGAGIDLHGLRKDGLEVPVEVALSPLETEEGRLVSSAIRDVSERRRAQAELLRTQVLLQQAQRVEAIGRLAGGVAHDFNNILGVITGYGELAQRQLAPEHPVRARVDQMLKAAERAASLTRQLLAFGRKQVLQPKLLDLNAIVADTQRMLGRLIGEDVDVVVHPTPGLGTVSADPGQIEQIVLNLAVNARDAMPKGGRLTLETANVDLDEDYAAAHPAVTPGRYVMLAVSDTGIGMDEQTQQRVFEPFFTTKPEGQGTGLGLATVYGIVKQSGGHIWVYSEPGRGTTFKVYLPRLDEPAEAARPAGPPAEAPRGHETILLVEDTATLQEVIRETLEERGYTVLLASNGEEALALARERSEPIHLLLTDVVMPKLGGGELARLLSALRPGLRVLYMSGYTDGAISQHGVLGEGVVLLEKPFTGDRLARAVRDALDGPSVGVTR